MKIKRKLQATAIIIIGFTLIMGAFVSVTVYHVNRTIEKGEIADMIVRRVFWLTATSHGYLLHPEERIKTQWDIRFNAITQLFAEEVFDRPEEELLLVRIQEASQNLKSTFVRLTEEINAPVQSEELKQRLTEQMYAISEEMVSDAQQLSDQGLKEQKKARDRSKMLLLLFVLVLTVFTISISISFYRSIVIPLSQLRTGAEIISAGNLNHQVGIRSNDELGQLAQAFNAMTKKLNGSYQSLQEEKVRYRALLMSIPDGVVAIDHEKRILMLNAKGEDLLGWKENEIKGKLFAGYFELFDEQGSPVSLDKHPFTKAFTAARTMRSKALYLKRKDRRTFSVALAVSAITSGEKTTGIVSIFRDITREKEIEKLRQDFLSLASHQLRTPLSGTKWLIETMQRHVLGPITKKQKEYLTQIYQVNERMIKLVFDMLNALRVESGAAVVQKEIIFISHLYDELSLMMESAAHARGVILHNALKNNTTVVMETDMSILRSILECFISNAINYSDPGQNVMLDAKEEMNAIVFLVKDGGIGIPKEEQKRVMERFYRASNAKMYKPDGTGLGLYISSMLAKKINAEILFESEVGKGSMFYLRVPKKVENINLYPRS